MFCGIVCSWTLKISFEKPLLYAVGNVNPEIFHCSQAGSAEKGTLCNHQFRAKSSVNLCRVHNNSETLCQLLSHRLEKLSEQLLPKADTGSPDHITLHFCFFFPLLGPIRCSFVKALLRFVRARSDLDVRKCIQFSDIKISVIIRGSDGERNKLR